MILYTTTYRCRCTTLCGHIWWNWWWNWTTNHHHAVSPVLLCCHNKVSSTKERAAYRSVQIMSHYTIIIKSLRTTWGKSKINVKLLNFTLCLCKLKFVFSKEINDAMVSLSCHCTQRAINPWQHHTILNTVSHL